MKNRAFGGACLIVLVASVVWSLTACGSGFLDRLFDGPVDAATPLGDGGDAAAAARCALKRIPERLEVQDAVSLPPVVFAFRTLNLKEGPEGPADSFGYDLDDACTCPEAETCARPDGGAPQCDRTEGRDNALGRFVGQSIAVLDPELASPNYVTDRITAGRFTLMLLLTDWNGRPDDSQVSVGAYTADRFEPASDAGPGLPLWQGTDRWSIDRESVTDGDRFVGNDCSKPPGCLPVHRDAQAYVRNGELVSHLTTPLTIATSSGRLIVQFVDLIVVARITGDVTQPTSLRLEGQVVGRWLADKMITSVAQLRFGDVQLCKSPIYDIIKADVCGAADLAASPARDKTGSPCEALSGAFSFTASPALLGTVIRDPIIPGECSEFIGRCTDP